MLTFETPRLKFFGYMAITAGLALWMSGHLVPSTAMAQEDGAGPTADDGVDDVDAGDDTDTAANDAPPPAPTPSSPTTTGGLQLIELLSEAGWFFMVPIWLASVGVVTLSIERFIALRRGKIVPDGLITSLGRLGGQQGGFDPRQAYRLCQQYPSSAATVIRAMLLKVGRPHSEVEHAVSEASEREANRLYGNVRWLTLAAAVAPLWGLLGTVWGMIMAFYDTAQLGPGQNKAEALATGIYTALVTTLCGLFIAIPSAIMAHYFEGRITTLFHEVDELLFNLLPQIERYEGRVRFNRPGGEGGEPPVESTPPPPKQPAAATTK